MCICHLPCPHVGGHQTPALQQTRAQQQHLPLWKRGAGGGSGSAFPSSQGKPTPPILAAKLSPASESRTDGQNLRMPPPWTLLGVPGLTHLQGAHGPAARGVSHLLSLLGKQNQPHSSVIGKIKQKGDPCEALPACRMGGASHKHPSRDHPPITCRVRHTCTPGGTRDRGPGLCHTAQKPPALAARNLGPTNVPSLPVSHPSCTGPHRSHSCHLQAVLFSSVRSRVHRGSRRVFCHLLRATSVLFSAPAPSPARNMSRDKSSLSWN